MRPLALPRDTTLPALRQAGTACECSAEREKLAYEAQDNWLRLFGRNLEAEFEINAGFDFLRHGHGPVLVAPVADKNLRPPMPIGGCEAAKLN